MTAILGISAYYHDSAAALVVDGKIVAAAQEERFTRKKHDSAFPVHAVQYCLGAAGLDPGELDYVGFYDKPLLKFERLLETYLSFAPAGFRSFLAAMPLWLREKLYLPREMRKGLSGRYRKRFRVHRASRVACRQRLFSLAVFRGGYPDDGRRGRVGYRELGDRPGQSHRPQPGNPLPAFPGFAVFGLYVFLRIPRQLRRIQVNGPRPVRRARYETLLREKLIDLKADGSFRLDLSYFNYCQGLTMTSPKFDRLFGGPPRKPEAPIGQREMDIAASIQRVTEDAMLRAARHVHERTKLKALCLAGGVALNCVANGRVLREGPFEQIWIQPASGDAGGALGTALFIWHQLLGNGREPQEPDSQQGSLLGPQFSDEEILAFLQSSGTKYRFYADEDELCRRVADLIAAEKVIGWLHGRVEFGPRALGCAAFWATPAAAACSR